MTTFNITTTAADQIESLTVTPTNGTSVSVSENGSYTPQNPVQATIKVTLEASCPADSVSFSEANDAVAITVEGTGSAPMSMALELTTEGEVSAVHWHKGYTTKASKAG